MALSSRCSPGTAWLSTSLFFRDTVLVRPRERVDIGLVPLDGGTWMMHCHILEHAESGMMTLFLVE